MKAIALAVALLPACAAHLNDRMRTDVSVQSGCGKEQIDILQNVRKVYVCRRKSGSEAGYHGNDFLARAMTARWDCEVTP